MTKYLFIAICLLTATSFGQNEEVNKKEPDVEIPKFVIYGTQKMNIGNVEKLEADGISILSESIINPFIRQEERKITGLSISENIPITVHDSVEIIKNSVNLQGGVYNIPFAEYKMQVPFNSGFFQGSFYGKNTRPFVDYADNYKVGGELKFSLFSENSASFLPSTNYNFIAGFQSDDYKFYGGLNPTKKRSLNSAYTQMDIKNLSQQILYFGMNVLDEINNIKSENYIENLLSIKSFVRLQVKDFNIGINIDYKDQNLSNNTVLKNNAQYLVLSPLIEFVIKDRIKLNVGINYSINNVNNNFALSSALAFKVNKNISFYLNYNPTTDFVTAGGMLRNNRFVDLEKFTNSLLKKSNTFDAFLKYELENFLTASGGFKYSDYSNLPFYQIDSTGGKFELNFTQARQAQFVLNCVLFPFEYGSFFGNLVYSDTHNLSNYQIPYFERLFISAGYEYNFGKIVAGTEFILKNSIYTDSQNQNKLNNYYKLDIYSKYNFNKNVNIIFKIDNIFNCKNFIWQNYEDVPLDISAGVSVRW